MNGWDSAQKSPVFVAIEPHSRLGTWSTNVRALLVFPLRLLKGLVGWLLALVILFEEWGWEPLQRALARSVAGRRCAGSRTPSAACRPMAALALFVLPTLVLLPVKLGALWLIGQGQVVAGAVVIVGAKVAGTADRGPAVHADAARADAPGLVRALHGRWTRWKNALLASVRASWPWRAARVLKHRVRRRWQAWRRAWGRG